MKINALEMGTKKSSQVIPVINDLIKEIEDLMEISSMNTKHIENAVKKLTYTDSDGDSVMYDKRLENMKKELDKRYKQKRINKLREGMVGYWIGSDNKLSFVQDLADEHVLAILNKYLEARTFTTNSDRSMPNKYYEIKIETLRRGLIDR